jgi:hypothetical protein
MKKLTCYTWQDEDPSTHFLMEAKNLLRAFWYQCEGTPGWSDLVKAFNRLVAERRFFAQDPERIAELLERLCAAGESRIQAGAYSDRATVQAIRANVATARQAAFRIQELFRELDRNVTIEEDVTTQRFFARQSR